MPKEFGRERRVADFIQRELAVVLQMEMKDPRVGMVSVNEVRVSRDLGYADIYVSSLNDRDAAERDELVDVLTGAAGWLRSLIARRSKMRTTPHLRFHWDALPEHGRALDRLIDQARASDREQDQQDDEAAHPDRENDSSGT
jgi:ribosome-binding factor A